MSNLQNQNPKANTTQANNDKSGRAAYKDETTSKNKSGGMKGEAESGGTSKTTSRN